MSDRQRTLAQRFAFEGVGVHTGSIARVRVGPAPAGTGYTFEVAGRTFPATSEHILDSTRATTIGDEYARVSTVEHLLSALFAMQIDNAHVEVEGPEIPIGDGSSAEFVDAIASAGTREQNAPRRYVDVREPLAVRSGDAVVVALPAPTFSVRVAVDHGPPIGAHTFCAEVDPARYRDEIAAARTYCSLADAEQMRSMGLVRGGSLERALVFGPDGPLAPLRWPGEPARHKALDLIGDLALVGAWPRAEFVAFKSGHSLHGRLAAALREEFVRAGGALAASGR